MYFMYIHKYIQMYLWEMRDEIHEEWEMKWLCDFREFMYFDKYIEMYLYILSNLYFPFL